MVTKFCAALLLIAFSFSAMADVVNPGEVKKQFMFTNLDKYPGFTYYYLHHGYHYNMGWQADPADTALVENNQRYTVSSKGNTRSSLMALVMTNSNSKYYISDAEVGGEAKVDPSITGITEVYTITGMENGIIHIKKEKEIVKYQGGKEEERKAAAGFVNFISNDKFSKGLTLISMGALLGMLLVFMLRRRKPKYIQLAT